MPDVKHDFDPERQNRTGKFKIGGEVFEYQLGIRPEVLAESDRITGAITKETETLEVLRIIDFTVEQFLATDEDREHWKALREREKDPVTFPDLTNLLNWLTEEQTGRPPTSPEPSSPGLSENGTPSMDDSSPALDEVLKTSI